MVTGTADGLTLTTARRGSRAWSDRAERDAQGAPEAARRPVDGRALQPLEPARPRGVGRWGPDHEESPVLPDDLPRGGSVGSPPESQVDHRPTDMESAHGHLRCPDRQ